MASAGMEPEQITVKPEPPHKFVPHRNSPQIQSIVSQRPSARLSYSKYIMLTDSLDIDDDYDDIANFLANAPSSSADSTSTAPSAGATNGKASASAATQLGSLAAAGSSPVSSSASNLHPANSALPAVKSPPPDNNDAKRPGPGRPKGSMTRRATSSSSNVNASYDEDDDDAQNSSTSAANVANTSKRAKHTSPPQQTSEAEATASGRKDKPTRRAAAAKEFPKDIDDDEELDDDVSIDRADTKQTRSATADANADENDEIEFKPRRSLKRSASNANNSSSSTPTATPTGGSSTRSMPPRKVGRPPNSANSSTGSLPLPSGGSAAPSPGTAAANPGSNPPGSTSPPPHSHSASGRRGPGRPPKTKLPLSSPSEGTDNAERGDEGSQPVSPLMSASNSQSALLGGENSQDSSQAKQGSATATAKAGNQPTANPATGKVPKRRGRPRKQVGEDEDDDLDASEAGEDRLHQIITVSNPSEFDSVLDYQLKNRPSKDTAIFVYLFGNRDPRKGESWCPECAQSDPIIKSTLAMRPKWILIECPVGERAEFKNKPDHPYRMHRKIQLKAIPTLIKWGNERPRAQLVEFECHQPKALEEFILKDKDH